MWPFARISSFLHLHLLISDIFFFSCDCGHFLIDFKLFFFFLSNDFHVLTYSMDNKGRCGGWGVIASEEARALTYEITYVKALGSRLWSRWRIWVLGGELSASTGGAVDVLSRACHAAAKGYWIKGNHSQPSCSQSLLITGPWLN